MVFGVGVNVIGSLTVGREWGYEVVSSGDNPSEYAYFWQLYDNNQQLVVRQTGRRFSTTVNEVGRYQLQYTIYDKDQPRSETREFAVPVDRPNKSPNAQIELTKSIIKPGEQVTIDASASTDPDGRITNFWWRVFKIGEGTDPRGKKVHDKSQQDLDSITVSYDREGEYTVQLLITDDSGASDQAVAGFTVSS